MIHPRSRSFCVACGVAAGAILVGFRVTTLAHPTYNSDPPGGNCPACHGDFDGPVSPQGTIFVTGSKHAMHRSSSQMNTECDLCHTITGDNPFTYSSAGTPSNPGLGCIGCHGRDYGGVIGVTGAGLRAHHLKNGVLECVGCHPDDPVPLPESVAPPYYGTFDTNAFDPCNLPPGFGEDFTVGDGHGLDNDGDDAYDAADPDCQACPTDLDGDQVTGITDLLALLALWGTDPNGAPDFDGDNEVGITDLLVLLASWGPC